MLSVIILNYSRPSNIKDFIIPVLEKYKMVDEIIISHGREDVIFEYKSNKVKHLYHQGDPNKEYGLTLRFVSGSEAKNDNIIIMDDDIIPDENTLDKLYGHIKEEEGIYGLYGRYLDDNMNYLVNNAFGNVPIVLTRCLICTKDMCNYFLENFRHYETDEIKKSKPYWNGEDILFSLLSIKKYDKLPESFDYSHYNTLMNYLSFSDAISSGKEHIEYRKQLTQDFVSKLDIDDDIKKTNVIYEKTQFGYFFQNSALQTISITILFFIILGTLIKIKSVY